jgi:formylglycine-generating enzyme required for sulfatase activity
MSYSPESVRNTSVGDQAANVDALGFEPYVIAIAEFLLNPETKPPLTLSIEGEWGSGKSSFMKQLEKYLREEGKQRTVWFNAWRHDKAEAVWAAFALSFIKQISTPQGYQDLPRAIKGYCKLQYLRFNREKGLFEVIKALPLIIFVICAAIAIPFILARYGVEGINELVRVTTSQDDLWKQIGAAFNLLFAVGGLTLSGTGAIAAIRSLFGNFQKLLVSPKNNLIKYLEAPDYKKQSAFIEEFHEDFSKIVDAYIGDGKVFVFIDDLDRCEHPKSADLMQAINLMITDDPSVVFILGMDREKVAASLAVKYESILAHLPSETPEIDSDILARRSASKGLAYGYTFIEKFVQLPFQVPQPSQADFERFFAQISTSQLSKTEHSLWYGNLAPNLFKKVRLFWEKRSSKIQSDISSNVQKSEQITANLEQTSQPLTKKKKELKTLENKRIEAIQLKFDRDSETVRDIIMMIAPALDYNPRRIKQFINVFRLKAYIASITGLFDKIEDNEGNIIQEPLTFQQLGKFTAISLKWPLLLLDLDKDNQLLKRLHFEHLAMTPENVEKTSIPEKNNYSRYWGSETKLNELIVFGCWQEGILGQGVINKKFSLAKVKVDLLLQVSPKVVRPTVEQNIQTPTAQTKIISLPTDFIEMIEISADKFTMGSNENDRENPPHEVFVNAFKIGKYPITQEQYENVMKSNPSSFKGNPKNPVENINWNDAQLFCQKLTQLSGQIYRLPTEAEWEYACRAGTQTRYYFGDDEKQLEHYAWYKNNAKGITHLVGQKNPNNWGIYDMSGNVWEWCADKWKNNYAKYNDEHYSDNLEFNDNDFVVVRGGSWEYNSERCRSAYRAGEKAGIRFSGIGFRVVSSQNT